VTYKYGKLPARRDAVALRLRSYLDTTALPPIPEVFGHQAAVTEWGMLANDRVGDCVLAGAFHETMLWNAEAGAPVAVSDACVIAAYSAVTGYDPARTAPDGSNPTDVGADPARVAAYRKNTGLTDAAGRVHTIAAYLALDTGEVDQLAAGAYLFGAVGVGLQMPDSAQRQFHAGEPWTVVPGAAVEGGHYVPVVGRDADWYYVVTWGRVQRMAPEFYKAYNDEAYVYLSEECLRDGKSPEGFDAAQLRRDLAALGGKPNLG
jgi:hypothetical protein